MCIVSIHDLMFVQHKGPHNRHIYISHTQSLLRQSVLWWQNFCDLRQHWIFEMRPQQHLIKRADGRWWFSLSSTEGALLCLQPLCNGWRVRRHFRWESPCLFSHVCVPHGITSSSLKEVDWASPVEVVQNCASITWDLNTEVFGSLMTFGRLLWTKVKW